MVHAGLDPGAGSGSGSAFAGVALAHASPVDSKTVKKSARYRGVLLFLTPPVCRLDESKEIAAARDEAKQKQADIQTLQDASAKAGTA